MPDCVIGGGIIGLATARLLARTNRSRQVILLEKEPALATHQTGRNSGVVHAGVYYEPGSLKARLCRRGMDLLEGYCIQHVLPYERVGKVVVATGPEELPGLEELHRRALANGVRNVRLLTGAELRAVEPHAAGVAALHSPSTAITDYAAVARQMARDLTQAGGEVRLSTEVARVTARDGSRSASGSGSRSGSGATVTLADGSTIDADHVIVCAGLQSDQLARASGQPDSPRIVPFRGEYYAVRRTRTGLVRGLIYPVPDPALPFLGIHLTRRIDGGVLVGPNAVPALRREGYSWRSWNADELGELARFPGAWKLARDQWRTGLSEVRRSASRERFVAEAQRYVPELRVGDVVPFRAGVRAQAVDKSGQLVDDFLVDQDGPVAWVRNAPSPAATSSLAIAEELLTRLGLLTP